MAHLISKGYIMTVGVLHAGGVIHFHNISNTHNCFKYIIFTTIKNRNLKKWFSF